MSTSVLKALPGKLDLKRHSPTGLSLRVRVKNNYFSTKTYVVGTQKNRLNETVLLSSQNMFKQVDKKIATILGSQIVFILTCAPSILYIYKAKNETPHIIHTLYMGVFHQSLANDVSNFER